MTSDSSSRHATKTPVTRKRFSEAEDKRLREAVQTHGHLNWDEIAMEIPGRTARQCRDRFKNYLSDEITREAWSSSEDEFVIDQYRLVGPRWALISGRLMGRSAIHVKNRWYKHLCRRLPAVPHEAPIAAEPEKVATVDVGLDWERIMSSACQKQTEREWSDWFF
jgi:hypothetical protein